LVEPWTSRRASGRGIWGRLLAGHRDMANQLGG
jgi:hypothetical protein